MAAVKKEPATPTNRFLPVPERILEHHRQVLQPLMKSWLEQKRVPPVLLITGPRGIGKRHLVHWLAQWLLCERAGFSKPAEEESSPSLFGDMFGSIPEPTPPPSSPPERPLGPCGECASCQKALKGNWVDFTEIFADTEDGDSATLKIEQFRRLKQTLGFGAYEGAFKVTLIDEAERMTVPAANSLLKVLEEPPPGWVFFLTSSDMSLLLPTLVSRCQRLRLLPFTSTELRGLLGEAGVPADRIAICSEISQGSWTKALTLASDDAWKNRATLFRFLEKPQEEIHSLVDWAAQDVNHLTLLLDQLEQLTEELLRLTASEHVGDPGSYPWLNSDGRRALSLHAERAFRRFESPARARGFWIEQGERIARMRQEANLPLNRKLLIQDILLPWLSTESHGR